MVKEKHSNLSNDINTILDRVDPDKFKQGYNQCSPDTTPDGTPYIALYDFEAQQEGDLPFRKGDTIYVTEMNGDWWEGQTEDGAMGTLPSNHAMKKN